MNWVPARKTSEGHTASSPHILMHSLSVSLPLCAFSDIVGLQTSNFLIFPFSKSVHLYWWQCRGGRNTAAVKFRFWLYQNTQGYRVSCMPVCTGFKGQCDTILWQLKSSLPLCSLLLSSLCLFLPCCLVFSEYFLCVFTLNPTALTCQESYKCSEWIM